MDSVTVAVTAVTNGVIATFEGEVTMQRPPALYRLQHCLATIVTLLVCVGVVGVATEARAQTVTRGPDTAQVRRDTLTRETVQTRDQAPDFQPLVGYGPQGRWEAYHLLSLAAADSSADGGGRSGAAAPSEAPDPAAELAKKLQNPIASLISVPIQNNWDFGIGPADAMRYFVNIQPVIPVSLTTDLNLIIRTIVPVIYAESPVPGGGAKAGLGDILQSFFFSPQQPTSGGWIVGAGPVFLYPSATDTALGAEKFGLGPTAVALKQSHGWTYGLLANHVWSVAGNGHRDDVNATFLQPFVSYTTKTVTTFGFNTETTYDWEHHEGTVPLNWTVQQLVKIGKQPVAFQLGVRYYAEKPEGGPDWGLRFATTLLFPQ